MMETYDLRKPEEASVPDFEYVYPEILEVEKNIFTHLGFGLYMIAQEDVNNKLTFDNASKYYRLFFAGFCNEIISSDDEESNIDKTLEWFAAPKTEEELVFVYSKKYSYWNEGLLNKCLLEKNSIIQVPPELNAKMESVIARIKAAEETGKRRESLTTFDGLWSSSETIELDTPFLFGEERDKGNYIMLGGKVGTRVADGVFKFKVPFETADKSYPTYLPEIPFQENAINSECSVLYEENWSWGTLSFMTSWYVHYLSFDTDSDYMKRTADFYGLKMHVFHKKPDNAEAKIPDMNEIVEKIAERMEEEEKNSSGIDVEDTFRQAGYAEIFKNRGYKGAWTINYLKLFDFDRRPQKITAEYAAFTETGIAYSDGYKNSVNDAEVLPYDILKYLRIEVKVSKNMTGEQGTKEEQIGHTFVSKNDDKELELAGEDVVELLKKLD